MEDDYTGGDICIDGSTDCIGNDIVYGSRTDILLGDWETGSEEKPTPTPSKEEGRLNLYKGLRAIHSTFFRVVQ